MASAPRVSSRSGVQSGIGNGQVVATETGRFCQPPTPRRGRQPTKSSPSRAKTILISLSPMSRRPESSDPGSKKGLRSTAREARSRHRERSRSVSLDNSTCHTRMRALRSGWSRIIAIASRATCRASVERAPMSNPICGFQVQREPRSVRRSEPDAAFGRTKFRERVLPSLVASNHRLARAARRGDKAVDL